jgi:hypothetical protein
MSRLFSSRIEDGNARAGLNDPSRRQPPGAGEEEALRGLQLRWCPAVAALPCALRSVELVATTLPQGVAQSSEQLAQLLGRRPTSSSSAWRQQQQHQRQQSQQQRAARREPLPPVRPVDPVDGQLLKPKHAPTHVSEQRGVDHRVVAATKPSERGPRAGFGIFAS